MSPKTRSMTRETYTFVPEDMNAEHQMIPGNEVPVLDDNNYALWRVKMRNYLMVKCVWGVVQAEPKIHVASASIPLTEAQFRENKSIMSEQSKAHGIIMQHLDPATAETLYSDEELSTPHLLWKRIGSLNEKRAEPKRKDLAMQFSTFVWKGKSVTENLKRYNWILGELKLLGVVKDPAEEITQFVVCTPPCYEITVDSILRDLSSMTLQDAAAMLSTKERRLKLTRQMFNQAKAVEHKPRFQRTQRQRNGKGPEKETALYCNYCKKKNHDERTCWKKNKTNNGHSPKGSARFARVNRDVALFTDTYPEQAEMNPTTKEPKTALEPTTELVMTARSMSERLKPWEFIIDSGASKHMTSRRDLFNDYTESADLGHVRTANNQRMEIHGKGTIKLEPAHSKLTVTLHDVLYVPDLEQSLFSVSACISRGCNVKFTSTGIEIIKDDMIVMKGQRFGDLFKLMNKPRKGNETLENAMVTTRNKEYKQIETSPIHKVPVLTDVPYVGEPKSDTYSEKGTNIETQKLSVYQEAERNAKKVKARKRLTSSGKSEEPRNTATEAYRDKDAHNLIDRSHGQRPTTDDRAAKLSRGRELLGSKFEQHRKLCHFAVPHIREISCKTCLKAKATRSISKQYAEEKAYAPGEFLHCDTMQMPVETYGQKKHIVGIVDDASDRKWAIPVRNKSDTEDALTKTIITIETETGRKLKVLRHDGGGEFISNKFKRWLEARGTRFEETHTNAPFENGKAERWNRTLLGGIRATLLDCDLPNKAWGESCNTVCYTHNRLPTTTISRHERYYGTAPALRHLQIFGQRAMVYQLGRNKLQSKAKELVFVGYNEHNTKGYRFLNVHTGEITVSKDAVFLKKGASADEQDPIKEHATDIDSSNPRLIEFAIYGDEAAKQGKFLEIPEPRSYEEAMKSEQADEWRKAMQLEIDALTKNGTWTLTARPEDRKTVKSKWVFKVKLNADGTLNKYKARLVALGYTQVKGIDYDDTFAPVARMESIRTVLAIAVEKQWEIHSMDVNNAYITSDIDKVIYMEQPQGFVEGRQDSRGRNEQVCLLQKSLYGTKQAGHLFNQDIHQKILQAGLKQSSTDPCIYYSAKNIVCLYVDDIIITGTKEDNEDFKETIKKHYAVTDNGRLSEILGIKIDNTDEHLLLSQTLYIDKMLDRFGMSECKVQDTPLSTTFSTPKYDAHDPHTVVGEAYRYREAIGSLLYLANCTRPDIAYAVSTLSQAVEAPEKKHWTAVKRLMRYLQGTRSIGLKYTRSRNKGKNELICFSDASYATGAQAKSISGCLIKLNGNTITWSSRKQTVVAQSTVESEYIALSEASKQVTWLREMLIELGMEPVTPTTIFEDNQGTIKLAENPLISKRSKHIAVRYHYIREKLAEGSIKLVYCSTENMIADALTKALAKPAFKKLRDQMGLEPADDEFQPSPRRGEVLEGAGGSGCQFPDDCEKAQSYFSCEDLYDYLCRPTTAMQGLDNEDRSISEVGIKANCQDQTSQDAHEQIAVNESIRSIASGAGH